MGYKLEGLYGSASATILSCSNLLHDEAITTMGIIILKNNLYAIIILLL
jgi:hypothetical protein